MEIKTGKNIAFDYLKFILILGVVAIHSNVYIEVDGNASQVGYSIVDFFSAKFTTVCVPCFFILSGYLYFNNIKKFTWGTYLSKAKSRIYTLLIPYLIWNTLDLILCILKYKYLGYPSYGVIDDDGISITRLLEGYWNYHDTYPYAFAFWFIRNLIVFVIISPVAYLIGGINVYILGAFLLVLGAFDVSLEEFEYFVIGCGIATFFKSQLMEMTKSVAIVGLILWVGISAVNVMMDFGPVGYLMKMICTLGAFTALYYACQHLKISSENKAVGIAISSTFFIYAVHQSFCSITRDFYIGIFGIDSAVGGVVSFLLSFATMVVISFVVWLAMRKFMPGVTRILSGGR